MSLINTRIQNVRAASNLDKNEQRPSRYGALDMFMQQSGQAGGILSPELVEKAKNSIGNTLQTPVIDFDGSVSIGSTRTAVIADDENTSQMYSVTFATYAWGFTMVPAMYLNNEIGLQKDFERKFLKYLYAFGAALDTAAVAALVAAKTQVFSELLTYTETGDVIQVPYVDRENIIGDINAMLEANDHYGTIHLLGNPGVQAAIRKMAEKGLYNSENKQLEYSDKILHFSNRLTNGAGEHANMIAVNSGSLGVLTRVERESLLMTKMADGTEWDQDTLPLLNMPVGTYYYQSRGDQSATAGAATADLTRGMKEHYGFAVDVAFLTPYNSDLTTIANPIMAAAILDPV